MEVSPWLWVAFNVGVIGLLALDLGVFHRRPHAVGIREAALWSAFWIALSLLFNAGIYFYAGRQPALEFLTGYLIEKSLSVDNIFVFVLIFRAFAVPAAYQHRVLFWGILSALVLRGIMIGLGAYLIKNFHFVIYLFGAFLVVTGIRLARQKAGHMHPEDNPLVRLARRRLPVTGHYEGAKFFVREHGRLLATPLLLVLIAVEFTDILFAVDSIPAIFAVTRDPFLVYTSNVFAILGLRALYFLLADVIDRFHYLKPALALILVFVGTKMLVVDIYPIPIHISLAVIGVTLAGGIVASLLRPLEPEAPPPAAGGA
jgi:tellurite resistance protein TerC